MPYAAYLRVYQPLTAFPEPERSSWSKYVSSDERPSRTSGVEAEHEEALRRVIAVPPIVVPARESDDAYVRRADGMTYICPWQVQLRSWLALDQLAEALPAGLSDAFIPQTLAEQANIDFEQYKRRQITLRPHIQTSTWDVPLAWFIPFDATERWLVLGSGRRADTLEGTGSATAAPARTLVYVTSMSQARRRVARALAAVRRHLGDASIGADVEDLGRWLEEFHPHALVELDYGGLVHLLDDAALRADQSVAEVATALTALENGEAELAIAMYKRVVTRWRAVESLESAN